MILMLLYCIIYIIIYVILGVEIIAEFPNSADSGVCFGNSFFTFQYQEMEFLIFPKFPKFSSGKSLSRYDPSFDFHL